MEPLFLLVLVMIAAVSTVESQNMRSERLRGMVLISGGSFRMGTNASDVDKLLALYNIRRRDLFEAEIPDHQVTLTPFYIDRYEVTNKAYAIFLKKHPDWLPDKIAGKYDNGKYLAYWKNGKYPKNEGDFPVTNVNWYAAMAFCKWAGKRLPTEAEWEYAARGAKGSAEFPWGNDPADPSKANYGKSGIGKATKVGRYPANGYGLYDVAGNVWEFTADEWGKYLSADQKDPLAGSNVFENNSFLAITTRRVIRGGSWGGSPTNLRIAYRDSHPPTGSESFVGFRCVMPAKENQ